MKPFWRARAGAVQDPCYPEDPFQRKSFKKLSFNLQVPGLIHLDNWCQLPFGRISQNDGQSSQHLLHSRNPRLRISLVVAGPNGFAQL